MGTNFNEPPRDSRRLLEAEIDSLRQRLEEAEVTLDAITSGRVDALVVAHPVEERQVLVLEDARRGDRLPIDRLRQGAITLSATGEVLHVNGAFAALLGCEARSCSAGPSSGSWPSATTRRSTRCSATATSARSRLSASSVRIEARSTCTSRASRSSTAAAFA